MADGELVHQLQVLMELRTAGVITEEEFRRAKDRVLGSATSEPAAVGGEEAPTPRPAATTGPAADPQAPRRVAAQAAPHLPRPLGGPRFVPGPRPQRPTAYIIAGSGALTLLAFFAMPLISVPILGSVTGAGVAEMSSEVGALGWLWLVPLSALAVTGIGAWQSFAAEIAEQQRRGAWIAVAVAAAVAVLVYLIAIIAVQSALSQAGAYGTGVSVGTLVGVGFWIALLAMIVAAVAAVADLRSAAR